MAHQESSFQWQVDALMVDVKPHKQISQLQKQIDKAREAFTKAEGRVSVHEARWQSRLARLQRLEERLARVRIKLQDVNERLLQARKHTALSQADARQEHVLSALRVASEARRVASEAQESARIARERTLYAEERLHHYGVGRHTEQELLRMQADAEHAQHMALEAEQSARQAELMVDKLREEASLHNADTLIAQAEQDEALIAHVTAMILADAAELAEDEHELLIARSDQQVMGVEVEVTEGMARASEERWESSE